MTIFFRLALLFLLLPPLQGFSEETPSMNAGSSPAPGFGAFAGIGQDRPKGARTEITATQEATFDNAANIAEFIGRVVVRDPQFTLTCDRLKVTLSKDRKGLETAVATGNVVIIQEQVSGNQQKAIGRAGEATYVPATGDVTLRIWPSVQQGINTQVATEESTVMILNRNGKSTTRGSSKTVISDTEGAGGSR